MNKMCEYIYFVIPTYWLGYLQLQITLYCKDSREACV